MIKYRLRYRRYGVIRGRYSKMDLGECSLEAAKAQARLIKSSRGAGPVRIERRTNGRAWELVDIK